jgi:hypothetical protein
VGDKEGDREGPLGAMDGPVGRTDGTCDGILEGLAVGENTGVPVKAVESKSVTDLRTNITKMLFMSDLQILQLT